jgi:transcriptional regulator with XRE-family HTH domain
MAPEELSFQEQFRILIDAMPAPDGHPYSVAAIAKATELSEQSLFYLLEGKRQYPRLNTVRQLCRFYSISLDYFDCVTEADCRAFLVQHASQNASPIIHEIDKQSNTLTPLGKRNVLRLLERLRHLRGSSKN